MTLPPASPPYKPGRVVTVAVCFFFVAIVVRTATIDHPSARAALPVFLGMELASLALFGLVLWRPPRGPALQHAYFAVQSALIVGLSSLPPHLDFIAALFVLLSYQAALLFRGRVLWAWCAIFILFITGAFVIFLGPLQAMGVVMTTIAGCAVFPAFVVANRDAETARAASQGLLRQLEESHRQLQAYAAQVEELAAMDERNRLARALHDSVSQTMFSIVLTVRSTQILLDRNPGAVRHQLEQLQQLTNHALTEMRAFISQLRPKSG